jgi:integrase
LEHGLLVPSNRSDQDRMLDNVDRSLDKIGERSRIDRPRLNAFRHSYISARVQTLDGGHPIALFTVAREVGHSSTRLIEDRYGHLVHVAQRSEVVDFRLDYYRDRVQDRVALMAS